MKRLDFQKLKERLIKKSKWEDGAYTEPGSYNR